MKKIFALLLVLGMLLSVGAAYGETMPIEGKVVSTQSYPIISQAKGTIEQINYSVGDRVSANDCIATITTTKVFAPVTGTVYMWGRDGDNISDLTDQYGAVAYIEPSNPYTITTKPLDANGKDVIVHPGQKVYLICMSDGKKTGEGVITNVSGREYTVRIEQSNFDSDDKISIYTTIDHRTSNRIGRGTLTKAEIASCSGTGYIVKTHVASGDKVKKGDLMYETIEGDFLPGATNLNQLLVPENGVVESFSVSRGQEISEKGAVAVIYPDSNMRIRALAPESSLNEYRVGDTVYITNQNGDSSQRPIMGKIEKISQIPEQTEYAYDMYYAVYIVMTDSSTLYYGMNVLVSTQNPLALDDLPEVP